MKKGFTPIIIIEIILVLAGILIIAGGAYLFGRKTLTLTSSSSASKDTLTLPNITSVETANWQTYTNSVHNYTIKYPNMWETYIVDAQEILNGHLTGDEVAIEKNGVFQQAFQPKGPHTILEPIAILTKKSTPTFDFAYTARELSKNKGSSVLKSVTIDGIEALRRDNMQEIEFSEVLFQKDNFIYTIVLTKPEYVDIFNKMIATFKFTK